MTTTKPKLKRRFLRISLRTLLVCILVVGVLLGWRVERARKQREVVAWILQSGGKVIYDYERDDNHWPVPKPTPPGPKWLRELLGIDFFDDVVYVGLYSDQVTDVKPLARLTSLYRLDIVDTPVSDPSPLVRLTSLYRLELVRTQVKDVTPLAGLTSLEELSLTDTQVKDVRPLAGLTSLKELDLNDTQVEDVTPLAGLTSLETLRLDKTQVTDVMPLTALTRLRELNLYSTKVRDVTPLAELTNLKRLILRGTQVSKDDYERLQEALPNCRIRWSRAAHSYLMP